VHDVETQQVTVSFDLASALGGGARDGGGVGQDEGVEEQAVAAVCFSPTSPQVLYAAVGRLACCVDMRAALSSVASSEHAATAKHACSVVHRYNFCKDDISHVAVNSKSSFMALGDDTGAVQVVDLGTNKLYKSMRQAHSNICSSVAFRRHRPWELLSGSLDMTVARSVWFVWSPMQSTQGFLQAGIWEGVLSTSLLGRVWGRGVRCLLSRTALIRPEPTSAK
jgi:hypothetical protein